MQQHSAKNVVIFATADWDTPYKTNKQHMAEAFARDGWRVVYFESPGIRTPVFTERRDLLRSARRILRSLRQVRRASSNIWVASPIQVPLWVDTCVIKTLNSFLMRWQTRFVCWKIGFKDCMLWCYHPFTGFDRYPDMFRPVVYHCVDDLASIPGVNAARFNKSEASFLQLVDHVFVTNQNLLERFSSHKKKIHYLPNVVDFEHFSGGKNKPYPLGLPQNTRPIIGFHGSLSDYKLDFPLFLEVIRQNTRWNFVIIGDEREGQANEVLKKITEQENVYMIGFVAMRELPCFLARFDVAIMPMKMNEYTKHMFPMKYYEYVAAMVPVISTPIDFTNHLSHRITTAKTAQEMSRKIGLMLAEPKPTLEEALKHVGDNTWSKRFIIMDKLLRG